jgi:hypothetical protein
MHVAAAAACADGQIIITELRSRVELRNLGKLTGFVPQAVWGFMRLMRLLFMSLHQGIPSEKKERKKE